MARGRMINITVAVDRRLNTLSLESHLLYMMTVPHLDRDGLIAGDVDLLTSTAIPRRRELHDRAEELIQEWLACGLVLAYETDDTRVLFFQGFRKNNKIQYNKEGASQFPPPPGYHRTDDGLEPDAPAPNSRPTLELVQSNAGVTPEFPTVKLSEEEVKGNEPPAPQDVPYVPAVPSANAGRRESARMKGLNEKLGPKLRRPLADTLLQLTGTEALAETDTEAGSRALFAAHEGAVTLYQLGYRDASELLSVEEDWYGNDWRGKRGDKPSLPQFIEYAAGLRTGRRPAAQRSNGTHAPEIAAEVYA